MSASATVINIDIETTEKILQHKLKDGKLSEDKYCYWTRKGQFSEVADAVCPKLSKNYVPDKIREAASCYDILGYPKAWVWMIRQPEDEPYINVDFPLEVRLHFIIGGKRVGYFRCFGANKDFIELFFHSEHWVPKMEERRKK